MKNDNFYWLINLTHFFRAYIDGVSKLALLYILFKLYPFPSVQVNPDSTPSGFKIGTIPI